MLCRETGPEDLFLLGNTDNINITQAKVVEFQWSRRFLRDIKELHDFPF